MEMSICTMAKAKAIPLMASKESNKFTKTKKTISEKSFESSFSTLEPDGPNQPHELVFTAESGPPILPSAKVDIGEELSPSMEFPFHGGPWRKLPLINAMDDRVEVR
ncbi:hypothetical protein V6N12_030302 [Hibiscus sabdariffa]|uniref:Uncharacterized protein n=1 Tax=Hibiscus sabdariffa TaxID=183260 RepID=A0ABR2C0U5_9ROSI